VDSRGADRSTRKRAPARGRIAERELDSTLSLALAAAQVGTWSYDEVRREHWDATTKSLFGIAVDEEPDTELFLSCIYPEDRRHYADAFAGAIDPNGSGRYACDFRIHRADNGVERWLSSRGHSQFAKGKFVRLIGVVQDVTDEKRAEDKLRTSEEQFRGIFENAATGIALVSLDGRFLQCNPAYAERTGYSEDELRTMRFRDILHPEDRAATLEKNDQLLRGEIPSFAITGRYLRKDGSVRWMRRFVSLQRGADGKPLNVLSLATDMTDQVMYEHKIELLLREVNHRAKNMLGVVQAIARSSAAPNTEEFQARFAARVRAIATAHDLLVNSNWEGVDLTELVRSQLGQFTETADGRVDASGPALRISGGAAQTLGMAVHELTANAFKYGALSHDAGRVTVAWESKDRQFSMSWRETGGPPVAESGRSGFGKLVLGRMTKMALNGEVDLAFAKEGVRWDLRCPLDKIEAMPFELK